MDRKFPGTNIILFTIVSLSARRAWIEKDRWLAGLKGTCVALRKESVDRKFDAVKIVIVIVVALRKESVDRKSACIRRAVWAYCRSPQGERG